MKNRIKELRKARKMSQGQVARLSDTSADQISKLERNERRLTHDWMIRIASALNCNPTDLIATPSGKVPLVGTVKASGEIIQHLRQSGGNTGLNDNDDSLGFMAGNAQETLIDAPAGMLEPGVVAIKVEGNSMYPAYEDGDVLFYKQTSGVDKDCLRRQCVVSVEDGRQFVTLLTQGGTPDTYTLTSYNAPPVENIKVEWCSRVLWVKKSA